MSQLPTIECKLNGPYLVKGLENLRNSAGEPIPTRPVIALCRCGQSANKPFCDGTHQKIGFSGAKVTDASAQKRDDYRAREIVVHDNRAICAHAGHCSDGLPSVFKYREEPWIDPAGAKVEAIIETVRTCPSGALSYSLGGVEHRDQQREPAVTVSKDGPYAVVGSVQLMDQSWGEGASREHYTLCRCGSSKNKPFCDGTHWSVGFKDEKN
jgi:CDGSH-type Zn-finger protein/ferredoxin